MEQIQFREIVELFLCVSIYELKSESEVPNINLQFGPDGYALFKSLKEKPFVKEGYWTPDATEENINFVLEHSNDEDCLTVHVHDSFKFFELLMKITNSLLRLYNYYEISGHPRNMAMNVMRRIWLRMGPTDVENVEQFLQKQLEFANNMTLDSRKEKFITEYFDYDVCMKTILNRTFDETTRSMIFTIDDSEEEYELPNILYDIDDSNTCYIYGVQNKAEKKSKKIERKLYKLNKGIENPNVHPAKVYALILFIEQLKEKGITKVVVPGLQVLSYRYHEILSEQVAKDLWLITERLVDCPSSNIIRERYNSTKEWYDKLHDKQDFISFLKTEELYNLVYRLASQDPTIEITNEVGIQGDSINLKI